ncbi:hypothetical protein C8Q79DRAFT_268652 [Trametes meyenii]|nr:hypothetical protein C8Q79DRAFT_268652 [Trametes meyenii]
MVVLAPRFALLAALSSLAAISLFPLPAETAAIQAQHEDGTNGFVVARHSSHGQGSGETFNRKYYNTPHKEMKVAQSAKSGSGKGLADKPERNAKPIVPLPARIAHKGHKTSPEVPTQNKEAVSRKLKEHPKRSPWSPDPISRMERLWENGLARSLLVASVDGKAPHDYGKRHHHHDHHDHHDHDRVVISGDHDHVNVNERSVPRDHTGRVVVEGYDDHVHVHDHDRQDHDQVLVKGDNDHVHVHRSPSPHHHQEVEVKGDHDSVHVHRSPDPEPHHHHYDVILKGDHDHVSVHRRVPAPHRHHTDRVIVKGSNQHVHVGRLSLPHHHRRRHHHHHHHHHHPSDEVVVKGDDDRVHIHKRTQWSRYPIMISGNRGKSYLLHYGMGPRPETSSSLDLNINLRREEMFEGVPGSIAIVSPVANSTSGQRIASLVLANAAKDGTPSEINPGSSFVLDASEVNSTQLYLVPFPEGSTSNSTSTNAVTKESFVKVLLKTPVFDPASASLKPYCATFDPYPAAPAPMTMESCNDSGSPDDEHKSQVFAYDPTTGAIRPMWFQGEDDGTGGGGGTGGDDSSTATAPTGNSSGEDSGSGVGEGQGQGIDYGDDDNNGGASTSPPGGTNSTGIDPTTPASDKAASVTSFEDETLNQQFGDATRPPARMAFTKVFAEEAPSNATNVTLLFVAAAPEVVSAIPPAAKVAEQSSNTNSATSLADPNSTGALTVSTTSTAALVMSSSTSSAADSSGASVGNSAASSPSATTAALEVKVYNPYTEDASSDAATATSGTTTTPSSTGHSMASTMTPVSTAPYEWMFKQRALADLE